MIGFGGSTSAMNEGIKANRALIRDRVSFKEIHERFSNSTAKRIYSYKKAQPEYLQKLRTKLTKQNRLNIKLKILALTSLMLSIGALLYHFLFAYYP